MKNIFDKIRTPDKSIYISKKIINTCLIFLLGIILGIFSKWLDNMAIDNTIWWQNILGILESYSLLNPAIRKNLKVVITGRKGISYDRYKLRTEELNISSSVIFTDFIPLEDLPIFYNACELLTYPSFYEGFGLPPLEAMACGTPVITSNVTSLPELFYNSALLVNPYDVYALSYAIEKVLCDSLLKLTMVQKGLITSSNYTWQKTAKNTISAYEKIINSK